MKITEEDVVTKALVYRAATNPLLAVRIVAGPSLPRPGYPEVLRWRPAGPALDIWSLQESIYDDIKKLPKNLQDVILARFAEECTLADYGKRISRSRERVRQLEGKALRILRSKLRRISRELLEATEVVPIPGSALDPDWISVREAAQITGYCREHLRWLCRTGKVACQINPLKRSCLQISKASLRAYIEAGPEDGRRTGRWKEGHNGTA